MNILFRIRLNGEAVEIISEPVAVMNSAQEVATALYRACVGVGISVASVYAELGKLVD